MPLTRLQHVGALHSVVGALHSVVGALHATPLRQTPPQHAALLHEHRRRSLRLKGYDYSQAGAYFVTICTQDRMCLFGDIVDGKMQLNATGRMIEQCWNAMPDHFPLMESDEFIVMPNHIHGIVVLAGDAVGALHATPLRHATPPPSTASPASRMSKISPKSGSLAVMIRSFKSAVTKRINESCGTAGAAVWQRNYYEHIIRDDDDLARIRQYIIDNPAQWAMDRENPDRAAINDG